MFSARHNVIKTQVAFDLVGKTMTVSVRMRARRSVETIRERAQAQGLRNPDNHVRVIVNSGRLGAVQVTLSGPTINDIYQTLPPMRPRGLTIDQVNQHVAAFNQSSVPETALRFNGTDMLRLVAGLCA